MDPAQMNYTTTKKELLTIVFALDKFRSYLLGSKVIVFSDHVALKFPLKKPDTKSRLIRNLIWKSETRKIDKSRPWYADICNFLVTFIFPPRASRIDREKLESEAKYYSVLHFYHAIAGRNHYRSTRTAWKVLECGFYWPTNFQDAQQFVLAYDPCQ
ncbi:hypothetical protein CR513_18360, partial [Mucuna pruriens]